MHRFGSLMGGSVLPDVHAVVVPGRQIYSLNRCMIPWSLSAWKYRVVVMLLCLSLVVVDGTCPTRGTTFNKLSATVH